MEFGSYTVLEQLATLREHHVWLGFRFKSPQPTELEHFELWTIHATLECGIICPILGSHDLYVGDLAVVAGCWLSFGCCWITRWAATHTYLCSVRLHGHCSPGQQRAHLWRDPSAALRTSPAASPWSWTSRVCASTGPLGRDDGVPFSKKEGGWTSRKRGFNRGKWWIKHETWLKFRFKHEKWKNGVWSDNYIDDVSMRGGQTRQDHGDAMGMGVGRLNAMVTCGRVMWDAGIFGRDTPCFRNFTRPLACTTSSKFLFFRFSHVFWNTSKSFKLVVGGLSIENQAG